MPLPARDWNRRNKTQIAKLQGRAGGHSSCRQAWAMSLAISHSSGVYTPRRSQETVLYRVLQEHLETFSG